MLEARDRVVAKQLATTVSPVHLLRYLAEFDFRMNTREKLGYGDAERAALIVKGGEGKRLTYRQVG